MFVVQLVLIISFCEGLQGVLGLMRGRVLLGIS